MLAASLAGGILAGVFALLTSVTQTASICTARAYLAPIAVTLALSPNTLKLFRFYKVRGANGCEPFCAHGVHS